FLVFCDIFQGVRVSGWKLAREVTVRCKEKITKGGMFKNGLGLVMPEPNISPDNYVKLRVKDTGTGIIKDVHKKRCSSHSLPRKRPAREQAKGRSGMIDFWTPPPVSHALKRGRVSMFFSTRSASSAWSGKPRDALSRCGKRPRS